MSVTGTGELDHVPFPMVDQRASIDPEGMAHRALIIPGDSSGGTVLWTFQLDAAFVYRLLAYGIVYVNSSTTYVWGLRLSTVWLTVAGVLSSTGNWQVTGTGVTPDGAIHGTSINDGTYVPPPRGLLLADMRQDVTVSSAIQLSTASNANGIQMTADVWLMYWRREALTNPGFLREYVNG